ncbi:MAG: dockerin type I domain-containing protein, partial [Defluviitaleaceae bacterium]|nr:dockerin type I domain-containing protein [Defluviitaleaceae bacterium]
IPDYLNEIVYELDFLYKAVMNTSKDGALPEYLRPFTGYSGTTPQGGYESDLDAFGNPQRIIFNDNTDGGTGEQAHGVLRAQTLYAAGALAMACNTPLMQEYFPQRCANYLAAARKAFSAFQNHWSDNSWWRADPGPDNYTVDMVAAGQIPHTWSDEMLFAASNLLEVDTLDPANSDGMENTYAGWINSEWPSIPLDNCMLYGWSLEGPWYNLFLSLSDCQSPLLDSAKRAEARKAITDWADTLYSNSPNAWEQRYGVPLWYELMGPQVGWYFSGSMVGFPLMMAYGVSGDSKYLDTLETTWNYLLGTNPTSRSFISGLGAPATSPHYFVSEISKYEVSQYDLSGGAQGWADVAPGLPVADVQNYMFKSQWGAAFSSQGNRDKEELGGYPDTQSPNDPITANKYFAPLWRYQDSWNVDNEFVIGDIARQAASILPLIGTQADPAVRQADLSLSKNGAFTLEAAEGYGSLPVTVTAKNTGFSDMTALSVSLSGDNSADFAVTTAPAPSLAKDASTGFAVSPVAGLPIGRYTASVVVSGTDVNGSSVTRTLGLVFNVTAPITSARLSDNADGTVDLTDQGYAFPSLGVGYASADTLTVKLSNTGTQAIAGISVSADGTNPDDFTITQPNDSVAAGDSVTFAVTPNAGLDVGIYAARINVAASGFSAYVDVSFEVYEIEPAFGLFAGSDEIGGGTVTLKTLGKNYTDPSQAAGTFAVENTGKGAVTGLSAAVTSGGAYFAVTAQPSASVADRDSTSFTVTPNSGLAIGLYSGAITVTSGNAGQQTFDVTFRVYPYDIGAAVITDSSPTAYDVSVSDGDDPNSYADDLIDMSMAPGNHWYGGMFVSPWAGDDEFAYTYLDNLTGDTEVVAEITDPGNLWAGGNDARAGLMIRQGMGTQDPYYGIFIKGGAWSDTDPVNEIVTQSRQTSGGLAVYDYRSGASQWDPIWLKLTLSGGVVTASTSADGATWTVIDSQTCPVSGTYTAGLAVNGQFYGAPMTGEATFTNVQIGSGTPAGQPYPVTVLSSANGTVTSDKASAAEGETVTLTAAPDAGFELDTLTVTNDSTSEAVAVTNPAGAAYAFAMPDSGVTVSASFKETPAPSGIWKNKDIGTCQAPGSTAETDGSGAYSFVIDTTSIGELVYQADNFRYVYQDSLTGDQTIAGRVDQFTDPNGAAPHSSDKAGLMVRQDDLGFDESGDYSQWCGVFLSDGKIIWINKNGQYNTTVDNSLTAAAPVWLKLAKTGDTVTAWYSTDDVTSADQVANWVQVNSMTYSMNDPFAMGMAVSGYMYDGGTYQVWSPAHAEFSGVQLTPGNAPAVDKAALEAAVENALLLSEADYTADSWAVFESALADAEAVLADGNATQNEVNAALEALISAESDLVAAPAGEAALVSISVAAQPKLIYTELETLDLSGLSVTLSCDDGSSNTVAYADFADNGVTLAYSNGKPAAQGDVLTVSAHNGLMIVIFCDGLTAFTGALVVSMNSAYDLNGDGKVNSNDLAFLMTYLGKKASSSAAAMKCDLDGNGVVDASDYALLSAYIAAVAAATP